MWFHWLTVIGVAQPDNDLFANRATLTGTSFSIAASNVGATNEVGEPKHAGSTASHSVWWTWTAPASDSLRISTLGSDFTTLLAIYTGSVVSNLTSVASARFSGFTNGSSYSLVDFLVTNGTSYQIAVDGYNSATGNIVLSLTLGLPYITNQPAGYKGPSGTNVTFTVGASSSSPMAYQWLKNDFLISGATNASLTLTNVQASDGGNYSVALSNNVGQVVSKSATLWLPVYEDYRFAPIAGALGGSVTVDGTNTNARFNTPDALAVDAAGNIYVAEFFGNVIRKITPSGTNWIVKTIAGAATSGFKDGTNSDARFKLPNGVALDSAGSLYVTDAGNHAIRKMDLIGTNWVVSTLVSNLNGAGSGGIAVDSAGNVFFAGIMRATVSKASPSGGIWTVTDVAGLASVPGFADGTNSDARFNQPDRIAVDASGSLYVGDYGNHRIRKITPMGGDWVVTTFAGSGFPNGTDATNGLASFYAPEGVAVDGSGNIYVCDSGNVSVRKITPTAVVTTLAGGFFSLNGIAVDSHGVVFITENQSRIQKGLPVFRLATAATTNAFPAGPFEITAKLASYLNYQIQISSNLLDWQNYSNIFPMTRSYSFRDDDSTNAGRRFYRLVGP